VNDEQTEVLLNESFNNIVELGQAIRKKRKEKGYTIMYVAQQIGVSVTTISHMESSQNLPGAELLERICNFFGLSFHKARQILLEFKTEKAKRRIETNL